MRRILLAVFLMLSVLIMVGCGEQSASTTQGEQTQTGGSVVSVYDAESNLVGKYTYQDAENNTIDVSQFAKTGYKLEGIYDMNQNIQLFNGSGNQSPAVMLDRDYTAVLKYSPIIYQLVFEAGDGELENPAEYTKMIVYEEAVGLFPEPVQEGKEFDGWFDAEGNRFSNGTTPVFPKFTVEGYTLPGEVIQLYAHYTTKYCDVRLRMQDGSADIKLQVEYGQKLPDLTEYLKDDGSRAIVGFGVSPNASVVFADAVYTDLDLYALWREYKYINFVYSETETKVVKVFSDGNMATLPDGVWPGYEFEGWYSSALLSGNKITTIPFSGMADTYYAKWSVGQYTIQFVADGVLVASDTFSIEDKDIAVPQVPEKAHYTGRWEDYTLEYKNMIVNAVYEPETMEIMLMYGADYSSHTITYGEMYELPIPTKTGYEFLGWYYRGQQVTGSDGKSLEPYTFDTAVTLTAEWKGIACTLSFETNGGSSIASVTLEYGQTFELTQAPMREGYFFSGWFDASMNNEYIGSITLTKDTVIYAKWVKSVAIYDADGLKAIAGNPAGYYHLMANINLQGEEWTPILGFSGIFDGNGYKIYNFSLRKNGVDQGFVITNSGTIKNVTFSNVELASTVDGDITCSIGIVCAYNTGKLVNVTVEKADIMLNVTSKNANNTISIGGLAGESTGLISNCSATSEVVYSSDVRASYRNDGCTTYVNMGGIVGKDSGNIFSVNADFVVTANEYVHAHCESTPYYNSATKNMYLRIGGISGTEHGKLTACTASLMCTLYSDASGSRVSALGSCSAWYPSRYTYIGGLVGCLYETSSVSNCYSSGNMGLKRVGTQADSYEFATGGIVGKVDGGTVNNCASAMDLTVKEGFGGTMGGIVGHVTLGGKVSNVAYYGTIKTESFTGGWFGGLAGKVEGVLTKGYFCGKITSTSTQKADIAAFIETSGSVSKTIGNGNTKLVHATCNGSANNNYIIGIDYGAELLLDGNTLFAKLCLFETDIWGIDEETGLYLLSFPEKG